MLNLNPLTNKTFLTHAAVFVVGSVITYQITVGVTTREYEKQLEKSYQQTKESNSKVSELERLITSLKVKETKTYDSNGKLIKEEKETTAETTKETSKTKEETVKEEVKKNDKLVVKEKTTKEIQKNHLYVGAGFNNSSKKVGVVGYMRTIGIFNLGTGFQADEDFKDKSVVGTIGISF